MFGEKCEVFTGSSNDTGGDRCVPGIFLGATGNTSGTCNFMSLETGKLISRPQFKRARMSRLDIRRVEELAAKENQPDDFDFYYRDMLRPVEDYVDEPGDSGPNTGVDDGANPTVTQPPGIPLEDDDESLSEDDASHSDGSEGDDSSDGEDESYASDDDEGELSASDDDRDELSASDDDESRVLSRSAPPQNQSRPADNRCRRPRLLRLRRL